MTSGSTAFIVCKQISIFSFSSAKSPSGPDDRATYQFVDIQEIPQEEILNNEQNRNNDNEEDDISALLNDKNWPQPIPVNGPNSNKNIGGLLNKIANKWLEDKKSAYSKDFGTFVGRMSPRAHQISGLVSKKSSQLVSERAERAIFEVKVPFNMTRTFFDTFDPSSINLSKRGEKTNILEWSENDLQG